MSERALDLFEQHRPAMLAAAYRITGSVADAEDVVQDAWQRWAAVDPASVENPRSFLAVTASRLALNTVRARSRRRETYVGTWLPEPLVDHRTPEWDVLHREGLGYALDVVLSTMIPEQATAYVLRKVLDVDYPSIAAALEISQPAARQLVSRAQRAVDTVLGRDVASSRAARDERALRELADSIAAGEVERVISLLAPGSVVYADGGGKVSAARHPVTGADRVARFLLGIADTPGVVVSSAVINGGPGLVVRVQGVIATTVSVVSSAEGISALYFMRNPDKLGHIEA